MHEYDVYLDNSPEVFREICSKIETVYPNAVKHNLLIDVDGSTVQIYTLYGNEIIVYDDYDFGAVYVKSEMELKDIFL